MEWLQTLVPADAAWHGPLNVLLHGLHTGMIAFVLVGWLWRPLLIIHRAVLIAIWVSWAALGLYVGHPGYCILTDYHWRVLQAMGMYGLPPSYIELLLQPLWPTNIPDTPLAAVIGGVFAAVTWLSFARRVRERTHAG